MRRWLSLVVLLGLASGVDAKDKKHREDAFACNSDTFTLQSWVEKGGVSISPDGKNKLELLQKDLEIALFADGVKLDFTPCYFEANLEVGWSPDSMQFFMQCGDSSYNGYRVSLFRIQAGKIVESGIPQIVFEDFSKKHSCPERGPNNMFFLAWTPDSKEVFLVSEVSPTGDCKQGGEFGGYLVDVQSGAIVKRFGQRATTAIEKDCRTRGVLTVSR